MKNKPLIAVVTSHFVVDFTGQVTVMMYPILVLTLGLTYTKVGVAAAIYMAVNGITQPIFGYLGDRIGARYLVAMGLVIHGIFVAMLSQVQNFTHLVLILALAAIGSGMYHPLATGIANRSSLRRKGTAMGAFFIGGNAGFAVSPVISAIALNAIGVNYTLILIIPAVVAASMFLFLTRDSGASLSKGTITESQSSPKDMSGRRKVYLIQRVLVLGLVMLLRGLTFGGLTVFIPLLYHEVDLSAEVAGLALSLFLGGVALGTFVGGVLADRIDKKIIVIGTLLAATPFVLLLANAPGSLPTQLATFLAGLLLGASQTPTVMAVQEYMPRLIGAASGLALGFTFGAQAAGQALTGIMADIVGLERAISLLATATVLAVVVALLLPGSVRLVRLAKL